MKRLRRDRGEEQVEGAGGGYLDPWKNYSSFVSSQERNARPAQQGQRIQSATKHNAQKFNTKHCQERRPIKKEKTTMVEKREALFERILDLRRIVPRERCGGGTQREGKELRDRTEGAGWVITQGLEIEPPARNGWLPTAFRVPESLTETTENRSG